jgi:chromosome segregation ATPase
MDVPGPAMSRLPTIVVGLALLCGVAWTAIAVDEVPFALHVNAAAGRLTGADATAGSYADALFIILCLVVAAAVGVAIGWSLRGQDARVRETELQRRLLDTKGRIPKLESGMRNREMQVARVEQQLKEVGNQIPSLQKSIDEGEHALRDRDRTITMLRGELSALKCMQPVGDAGSAGLAELDLGDFGAAPTNSDAQREVLEAQLRELETQMRARQARIAELMHEQGKHATRIPELESELQDQRKRSETFDRERQRQDKWLDVLNDQLARAREANDKLTADLANQKVLQQRIVQLEAEVKRLGEEIADRERRLAASRFECATARTTITHLQAQLERNGAAAGAK